MKIFYDRSMAGHDHHAVDAVAAHLEVCPVPCADLVTIDPSTLALAENLVAQVHDLNYVRAVVTGDPRDLAQTNGSLWHDSVYAQAIARTAGVVAATVDAVDHGLTGGTLSPSMHRARRDSGADGCAFNGFAAAAWWVAQNRPDHTVVVLDFSAAFASGTSAMLATMGDNIRLVDLSTDNDDWDAPTPEAFRVGPPEHYLDCVHAVLDYTLRCHPDVVLANMSADLDLDPSVSAARDCLVADEFRRAEVPVAFSTGQQTSRPATIATIANIHIATIGAFA